MKVRSYRAAGAVVVDGDRVLVLDRPSRAEIRLPKGHVRAGEAPDVAAVREALEETGYRDLRVVAELGSMVVSFRYEGRRVVRREQYYLMRLAGHTVVARPEKDAEQFAVLWLPADEAVERLSFDEEREWLRRGLERLAAEDSDAPS